MDEDLLQQISGRTGPLERAVLTTVVRTVASAIASRSGSASRAILAGTLGEAPIIAKPGDLLEPAQLYDAVAAATSWRRPAALELAQTVLVALARAVGPRGRARLCDELPPQWARLLEDPHDVPSDRRPAPTLDPHDGRTLATGHPGANASLGGSRPIAGQRDSISRCDDPHGDRKLSGATGPVPEHRTLAGARR